MSANLADLRRGDRVELNGLVERYPHFSIDFDHEWGTVLEPLSTNGDVLILRMDRHYAELVEWGNAVHLYLVDPDGTGEEYSDGDLISAVAGVADQAGRVKAAKATLEGLIDGEDDELAQSLREVLAVLEEVSK